MDYMFKDGFLYTKAPFFMDSVTIIVAILPILLAIAIFFAKIKQYKLHKVLNILIFVVSTVVLIYFEYGVRAAGGFSSYLEDSLVNRSYFYIVLISHIIVSIVSYLFWIYFIIKSLRAKKGSTFFKRHKFLGKLLYILLTLTSISGIWVYILLFVV